MSGRDRYPISPDQSRLKIASINYCQKQIDDHEEESFTHNYWLALKTRVENAGWSEVSYAIQFHILHKTNLTIPEMLEKLEEYLPED